MDNPMFGSVLPGVIALLLFGLAWFWNSQTQDSRVVGWICVGLALVGSVVLYASALAAALAGYAASLFNGVGNMIGVGNFAVWALGILCIGAFGLTIYDLWYEPEHNPRAVGALIIAPIAAHGTSGVLDTLMQVAYGGFSLGSLAALQKFFGG